MENVAWHRRFSFFFLRPKRARAGRLWTTVALGVFWGAVLLYMGGQEAGLERSGFFLCIPTYYRHRSWVFGVSALWYDARRACILPEEW